MDDTVLSTVGSTIRDGAADFGLVPVGDPARYLRESIASLQPVLEREFVSLPPLWQCTEEDWLRLSQQLTDQELLSYAGVWRPYQTRSELLTRLTEAFEQPTFFLVLASRYARNPSAWTSGSVGYGLLTTYRLYSLTELYYAWSDTGRFVRPNDYNSSFDSLESLQQLLPYLPDSGRLQRLLPTISVNEETTETGDIDNRRELLRLRFSELPESQQTDIREQLRRLYLGTRPTDDWLLQLPTLTWDSKYVETTSSVSRHASTQDRRTTASYYRSILDL